MYAISSALPLRRSGTVWFIAADCIGLTIGLKFHRRGQVGVDPARLDDVGPDAPIVVNVRRGPRHAIELGGAGGRVGRDCVAGADRHPAAVCPALQTVAVAGAYGRVAISRERWLALAECVAAGEH